MKYLVTGGAGFIGTNITRKLVQDGQDVLVFDNLSAGRIENLEDLKDDFTFIEGDIRRMEDLQSAMRGVEVVLHLAARNTVMHSMLNPVEVAENNILGTLNVLLAARDAEVQRVVFSSSSSVYGNNSETCQCEHHHPRPLSPYGASKIAGEHYMHVFAHSFGVETVSLRYFNVFGPYQRPEVKYAAVIPIFVRKLLSEEPPTIDGDGEQSRDFTFVENVVGANLIASRAPAEHARGSVFNIGAGDSTSVNELFRLIRDGLKKAHIEPRYGPSKPGDIRRSQADITLAKERLGYAPSYSIRDGLDKTLAWHQEWVR